MGLDESIASAPLAPRGTRREGTERVEHRNEGLRLDSSFAEFSNEVSRFVRVATVEAR